MRKGVKNHVTLDVLTAPEAAARLRVHVYTIYALLRNGRLQGFKLNSRWRIKHEALEKFMASPNPISILNNEETEI